MTILLYGAYGYTGRLIAEELKKQGQQAVLAGRREEPLRKMAEEYGWEYQAFDLSDQEVLDKNLYQVPLVIHAAGPFIHTAQPMIDACLRTQTHYLDITGEVPVFELAAAYDDQARAAGVVVMPGTGFDVVPTDCAARYLKDQLPEANDLQLAFASAGGGFSRGTALTMVENLGKGGVIRRDGQIINVKDAYEGRTIPFMDKDRFAMTIPWGDVSTAYHTTGIPNVKVFMSTHPKTFKRLRRMRFLNWLLKTELVKSRIRKRIEQGPAGPDAEDRQNSNMYIWGQATAPDGSTNSVQLKTPSGYALTAMASVHIAKRVLNHELEAGFHTPAGAFGADLIMEFPGVERREMLNAQ